MVDQLTVTVSQLTGLPITRVPRAAQWALVEYLAGCRARVTYRYEAEYLTVCFLRLDCRAAQALLDAWVPDEAVTITSSTTTGRHADWLVGLRLSGRE